MSVRWPAHWSVLRKAFDRILHLLKCWFLLLEKKEVKMSNIPNFQWGDFYIVHYQYRIYSSTSRRDIFFMQGWSCSLFVPACHAFVSLRSHRTNSSQELSFAHPSRTVPRPHLSQNLTMLLLLIFIGYF